MTSLRPWTRAQFFCLFLFIYFFLLQLLKLYLQYYVFTAHRQCSYSSLLPSLYVAATWIFSAFSKETKCRILANLQGSDRLWKDWYALVFSACKQTAVSKMRVWEESRSHRVQYGPTASQLFLGTEENARSTLLWCKPSNLENNSASCDFLRFPRIFLFRLAGSKRQCIVRKTLFSPFLVLLAVVSGKKVPAPSGQITAALSASVYSPPAEM